MTIDDFLMLARLAQGPRDWAEIRSHLVDLVAQARDEEAEACAWAVGCDGNLVSVCLTETAATLIAENLREKNRGRDFDWQVVPLYARIVARAEGGKHE